MCCNPVQNPGGNVIRSDFIPYSSPLVDHSHHISFIYWYYMKYYLHAYLIQSKPLFA